MRILPKNKTETLCESGAHNKYIYVFCSIPLVLLFVVLIVRSSHTVFPILRHIILEADYWSQEIISMPMKILSSTNGYMNKAIKDYM